MQAEAAARLEGLLDHMRSALLAGDTAALDPLGQETERILAEPLKLSECDAQRLRDKAERNLACLLAAARGLRAARRRLAEVRAATSGGLATYDEHGHRAEARPAATLVQRL